MRKKEFIFLVVFLSVLTVLRGAVTSSRGKEYKVIEAFQGTDFEETESVIEAYGLSHKKYLNENGREKLLQDIAERLQLEEYGIEHKRLNGRRYSILEKEMEKCSVDVQFVTLTDDDKQVKQYLILRIVLYDSIEKALDYREMIEDIINKYKIGGQTTMNLKGIYAGNLSLDEKGEKAAAILEELDAEIISENRSEELFTIYAYSKYLKKYKGGSYEDVNLNIAMNYNEIEDNTYLYLATPVIKEDY